MTRLFFVSVLFQLRFNLPLMLHLSSTRDGVWSSALRIVREIHEIHESEPRWRKRDGKNVAMEKREKENLATIIHTGAILHRWPTKTKTTTNRKFRTRTEKGNYEVVIEESTIFSVKQKTRKKNVKLRSHAKSRGKGLRIFDKTQLRVV